MIARGTSGTDFEIRSPTKAVYDLIPTEGLMRLYWSLTSIPELSGLSPNEQGRLWRSVRWKMFFHWQIWLAVIGVVLGSVACGELGRSIGHSNIGFHVGSGVVL